MPDPINDPININALTTLDSTDHDVMQDTGCVKARLSWHAIYFPFTLSLVNLSSYQRTCPCLFLAASPLSYWSSLVEELSAK